MTTTCNQHTTERNIAVELAVVGARSVRFFYLNWRGEGSQRRADILSFWFGTSEYHSQPQWFAHGLDLDRSVMRDFAVKDMQEVTSV